MIASLQNVNFFFHEARPKCLWEYPGGGNFHRVKCHGLKNLHSMRLASFYSDLGGIRSTINWAMKKTLVLGIALPSYITGIIITHCKDPYQPTSIMESKAVFFFVAQLVSFPIFWPVGEGHSNGWFSKGSVLAKCPNTSGLWISP